MVDRQKIMEEYRRTVGVDSAKARALIKKLPYKDDHYLLQCIAQTYKDESVFEEDGTMRKYVDERKWRMAERYIIKAFDINPICPDVLWVMGSVRKIMEQIDLAVYCFKKIIELGIKGITKEGCELNIEYARELINDSKFELYRIYHGTDTNLSKKYLAQYKHGLIKGANTIYKPLEKFLVD